MKELAFRFFVINSFFQRNKRTLFLILKAIVFVVVMIFLAYTPLVNGLLNSNNEYAIIVLTGLVTIIALLIALFQINQNNRLHKNNITHSAVLKSVEILKQYQEDLIYKITMCLTILEKSGIESLINEKLDDKCKYIFDKNEAIVLFGDTCFDKYTEMLDKVDATSLYLAHKIFSSAEISIDVDKLVLPNVESLSQKEIDKIKIHNYEARAEFSKKLMSALNSIEWIAILCKTGAADENVIYQSMHPKLLRFIRACYLVISKSNENTHNVDKRYCNVIDMYSRWNSLRNNLLEKAIRAQKRKDKNMVKIDIKTKKHDNVRLPTIK